MNADSDPSIQGFSTQFSVNRGETVHFNIRTDSSSSYWVDIFRVGYYGGAGARLVNSVQPHVELPQLQPGCDRY